jgi:uncharacterized protein involved in type VI secretion and phage assembly
MKPHIGVALGIVTSLDDPQQEGRIQVRFTSFLDGGPESAWAAIASMMAGKGRGMFYMPEKDDEVLVAFDRGHFDHPYIIGFLWNGVDKPPVNDPHLRIIRSVNGHEISIYDPPISQGDKGYIRLQDSHGNLVELSNARITIKSVGVLTIDAPTVLINKRPVAPQNRPI